MTTRRKRLPLKKPVVKTWTGVNIRTEAHDVLRTMSKVTGIPMAKLLAMAIEAFGASAAYKKLEAAGTALNDFRAGRK